MVKNPPVNAGHMRCSFDPGVRKIPWRRAGQLTPVFLPGKSHGWRRLVGYSLWVHKESDTTEQLHFHFGKVLDFRGDSDGKESAYNPGSISGLGRAPGEGNGNPLQYSCLENSMDKGT